MCPTNNVNTLVHSVARLCKQVVSCVQWQTLDQTLPPLNVNPTNGLPVPLTTSRRSRTLSPGDQPFQRLYPHRRGRHRQLHVAFRQQTPQIPRHRKHNKPRKIARLLRAGRPLKLKQQPGILNLKQVPPLPR